MKQIGIAVLVLFVVLVLSSIPRAKAHDHNHPELNGWFNSLQSGKGPCCDWSEALRLDDVDWETKDGHYRVRIDGEWISVPDNAVVDGPNRAGPTMVWPYYQNGQTVIRCFLPGSMT